MHRWIIAMLFASQGCFAMHELDSEEVREHDAAFAGDWEVVASFGWALLETRTVYRLFEDGRIEIVDHREGSYFVGPAGQWAIGGDPFDPADSRGGAPLCEFGDRWWSVGSRLAISSVCDDGTTRALELRSVVSNAARSELEVAAPVGAAGFWEQDEVPGSIRRCTDCE